MRRPCFSRTAGPPTQHDLAAQSPRGRTIDEERERERADPGGPSAPARFAQLVASSAAMREAFAVLERVASSDVPVLLEGETGTGKELAAEGIHRSGFRADGAFVVVDCGVEPHDALAGELFGVEGADARAGAFVGAAGGTVLLDEVALLPTDLQAKLARALATGEVCPTGSSRRARFDARVVASTARDLEREVREGRFREDLYYRLASVVVALPPLRTRLDDVPALVESLFDELNRRRAAKAQPPYAPLPQEALAALARHDFPGNVRELRNLVERFAVLGFDAAALVRRRPSADPTGAHELRADLPFREAKDLWMDFFDRSYLAALLAAHRGNVSAVSRTSRLDRRHIQRLMIKHGLRENAPR